jgi:diguanylate cyclase (GGDEF)-like protein
MPADRAAPFAETPVAPSRSEPAPAFAIFLIVTIAAGAALSAPALAAGDWSALGDPRFWILAAFVLLGELFPIRLPGTNEQDHVTLSTPFAFALLLSFGAAPALAAYAAAAAFADAADRTSPLKLGFNVAQYALCVLAAAAVLELAGHPPPDATLLGAQLPLTLLAAFAMFAANQLMVVLATSLSSHRPVLSLLRGDVAFQAWTAGFLLSLGPVTVAAADRSLVLVPLLFLPMVAIYVGGRHAVLNEHRARHDELTELPNRLLFGERLREALGDARRHHGAVATMLLDLDDFKAVNDTLGHHHGDELLRALAERLGGVLGERATLARFGGDEFAVLLPDVRGAADGQTAAAEILAALEHPFELGGLSLEVRASIGIAVYPQHGITPAELVQHADVAMYAAKAGRDGYALYRPEDDDHTLDRLALAGQLRRGIERGELVLHYQPKLSLRGDRADGVEALARWNHPQLGLIGPDGFIALAEQSDLIERVTELVLDEALSQCASWREEGLDLRVAVNLSARSLLDRNLASSIARRLAENGLPAAALQVEITESRLVADLPRARETLRDLRDLGVGVAIDDFGTGFSSLAQLKLLPVDEIKIDKSFVLSMETSAEDDAIVRSTIELGRNLALTITAEGVETPGTYERLIGLGCDYVQGYHLGRPVPAEACRRDVLRFAEQRRATQVDGEPTALVGLAGGRHA